MPPSILYTYGAEGILLSTCLFVSARADAFPDRLAVDF